MRSLIDPYCLPTIVRVIKLRMRWVWYVPCRGRGEAYTEFWWENLRKRDHWGDPDIDGRIILRHIFRVGCGGMERIKLAQDRDRWWALVDVVMNLQVP
jgi:hypothetical protein